MGGSGEKFEVEEGSEPIRGLVGERKESFESCGRGKRVVEPVKQRVHKREILVGMGEVGADERSPQLSTGENEVIMHMLYLIENEENTKPRLFILVPNYLSLSKYH